MVADRGGRPPAAACGARACGRARVACGAQGPRAAALPDQHPLLAARLAQSVFSALLRPYTRATDTFGSFTTVNVLIRPVYELRLQLWAKLLPAVFKSREERLRVKMAFMRGLCPVGEDPIRFTVCVKNWAGECSIFFFSLSVWRSRRALGWTGTLQDIRSTLHQRAAA